MVTVPLTGPEWRALIEAEDTARENTATIKVPRTAFAHLLYAYNTLDEIVKPHMEERDQA